jgi:glycosyltransferase involved in cell wall biosynthesis
MINKRLLIFAAYFWPHKGGHEQYALETARRLHQNGWKIDIVTSLLPGTKAREQVEGMQVYRIPIWHLLDGTYPVPKPCEMNELLLKLAENKYAAVITHTRFFPTSFFGAEFAKKNKIPHLHVEHGSVHPKTRFLLRPLVRLYDHTFGARVVRSATIVAGVSLAAERFAKHLCNRKTILLPNAIDTNFFSKKEQNRGSLQKTITFVGRLIKAKGVQDLLAAAKGLSGARLLIVGSGPYEHQLRKMTGANVHFLGEKDKFGVRTALSKTDIFVNPSYSEGLPTSVLEAGAMGVPVIATDVGGTREILENRANGLLIEPKNIKSLQRAIAELLIDKEKRRRFGRALQKKVRREFDWNVTVKQMQKELDGMTR